MNRLWVQLTLGIALVTLASALTVALVANLAADTSFRGYLAQAQASESGIVPRLADHYAATGSWAGAEALLVTAYGPGGQGHGQGRGQGGMLGGSLVLADAEGRVVADPAGASGGAALSDRDRRAAIPIAVEGRTVGYLAVSAARGAALPAAAQRFLATLNGALWVAGVVAGLLGLGLGLLMARGLAAPLGRLAAGAQHIAAGRLAERVPVAGPAELRTVAAAFNEMAAALQAGESQRRQMVADIAHELRTPLTVIQGNLRAMLDEVYPLSKAEVATIYEASLGLRRLVDDLRELSLAETGRLQLHIQPVPVAPLLRREVALFADAAAAQGVSLRAEPAADLTVRADPERLAQVLHNLLSNALRHTPAGGRVTLGAAPVGGEGGGMPDESPGGRTARPDQIILRPSPLVLFEVSDTGAGIAESDLPLVFERFYRADRGRARADGGSGLGLAITRQLVRLQGGAIGVESAPGRGSRFWFTLPMI